MFSTITSSVFSRVIVVYRDYDIRGVRSARVSSAFFPTQYHIHFEVFRKLQKVREFQLVLCADVWGCTVVHAVRKLEQAVATERTGMGFDDFFREPLVIFRPRGSSPISLEDLCAGGGYIPFATL